MPLRPLLFALLVPALATSANPGAGTPSLTLAAASVWGFLEQFETVPHIPLYYAFVFYWAAFGVVQLTQKVLGK